MAEEQLTLTYAGSALDGGRMSVRELAPALLALADATTRASAVLDPLQPAPRLEIQATRAGSFAIQVLISDVQTVATLFRNALDSPDGEAAANLSGLVAAIVAAFAGLRRFAHRRIRSQEQLANNVVRLILDDGTTVEMPLAALTLAQDFTFRIESRKVVGPLTRDGVDELTIEHRTTSLTISKNDVAGFDLPPAADQLLLDNVRETVLTPLSVAFQENNKWRVSEGDQSYWVTVDDQDFIGRVLSDQEAFAHSDLLRVQLRTRQYNTDEGLRTDRMIERVLEHIAGTRPVPLPLEGDEPSAK